MEYQQKKKKSLYRIHTVLVSTDLWFNWSGSSATDDLRHLQTLDGDPCLKEHQEETEILTLRKQPSSPCSRLFISALLSLYLSPSFPEYVWNTLIRDSMACSSSDTIFTALTSNLGLGGDQRQSINMTPCVQRNKNTLEIIQRPEDSSQWIFVSAAPETGKNRRLNCPGVHGKSLRQFVAKNRYTVGLQRTSCMVVEEFLSLFSPQGAINYALHKICFRSYRGI